MARPQTKDDLITSANNQFEKLLSLIDANSSFVATEFNFTSTDIGKEAHWGRDKNMRDVYIHLHEWHNLLLAWIKANQKGEDKSFLPAPYNWKTYGEMNIEFFNKHQSTEYQVAYGILLESHNEVMELISSFTNDELFTNKHFKWTGTTSLGSYCVSATSSHYEWAIKKLKKHIKSYVSK